MEKPRLALRARTKEDMHGIYQLYNRVAPANVRAIEGATFREWQAALEPWGARTQEFVLDEDGAIAGWLRLSSGGMRRMAVLGTPGNVEELLRAGLSQMTAGGPVLILAAEHEIDLRRAVEAAGFEPSGDFAVMAKRLVVLERELVPETTGKTVPVN